MTSQLFPDDRMRTWTGKLTDSEAGEPLEALAGAACNVTCILPNDHKGEHALFTHTFHPIEFAGDRCECGHDLRSVIHTRVPQPTAADREPLANVEWRGHTVLADDDESEE